MKTKKCIICDVEKEIFSFYKHNQMSDGHLNKCISCCKEQAIRRNDKLSKDVSWALKERERSREKYHRLGYKEKQTLSNTKYPWKNSNVYKGLRKWYEKNNGFLDKNIELHHWSYEDENLKDVILLTRSLHKKIHAKLKIDIDKKCFVSIESNEILNTKEKHLNFIKENLPL
jgi:hypothetical protein